MVTERLVAVADRLPEAVLAGVRHERVPPSGVCRAIPSNTVLTIRLVATPCWYSAVFIASLTMIN